MSCIIYHLKINEKMSQNTHACCKKNIIYEDRFIEVNSKTYCIDSSTSITTKYVLEFSSTVREQTTRKSHNQKLFAIDPNIKSNLR